MNVVDTDRFDLVLTPHGVVTAAAGASPAGWRRSLAARFAEGEEAGLLALGAAPPPPDASASVAFWREPAAAFLRAICHIPSDDQKAQASDLEPLPPALASEWILRAPPMPGAEYLSLPMLDALWMRLARWAAAQAAAGGSWGAFIETYAPRWARVGRVTLHLAEHKGDADYPFAFMATYAAGLSRGGREQRVPLGRALQDYAGAGRKPELLKLLAPLHAAERRSELIADLVKTGDVFHPLVWTPSEAYAFLREIPLYEECGLLVRLPDWWRKRPRPRVNITLDTRKGAAVGAKALLEFRMDLALDGAPLSPEEEDAILNAESGLTLLRGQWVEVDADKLKEALEHWRQLEQHAHRGGLSFAEGMRLLAGAPADLKGADAADAPADWSRVAAGERLREALRGLRDPLALAGDAPESFQGTLRAYQTIGLNWLDFCARLGLGGCLADDMGLGKTIQVLAALLRERQRTNTAGAPSLLIVPASLIANWKAEAARFAPTLRLLLAHPSETPATTLADGAAARGCDLVITTYGMLSRLSWMTEQAWNWVILDEAQAIKNPSTTQTRAVKKVRAQARFALTGTPVENRLGDLWSIFDFLNPGLLGSAQQFKTFVKELDDGPRSGYAPLRALVAPYILRRLKTDPNIAPDLPEKIEMQIFCGLSKAQAALYRQQVEALAHALQESTDDKMRRRGLVLAYLMRFKQICNHPSQLIGDGLYAPEASAKFLRLGELCGEIAARGGKALLFTQFRELTEPLADYISGVFGRPGLVLHGGTPVKQRRTHIDAFQREDGPPFFVLSLKAGGTGLNLTEASHVIHVDRWWNPAVENQATDRAFRIGQRRNVLVHKFVTRGTVEEKIDALIADKRRLAEAILEGGAEKALTEMSDEDILRLVALDLDHAAIASKEERIP
jgi:superfamily II DNA or RNA helicase